MQELEIIENKIYEIRENKVMFDFDLAEMYNVETKRLKEQVRRNIERFPEDFMFQLNKDEWQELVANSDQFPAKIKHSYIIPSVFTQEGVAMLSGVLRSPVAIQVNINIMRAFVRAKKYIAAIAGHKQIDHLQLQLKYIQEDIESLNKDHEVYDKHFEELFSAFAELSSKILSKNTRLNRVEIAGFKKYKSNDKE